MPTLPFGLDEFCSPLAQFFVQLWYFIAGLGIPLPIGIIGAWRWGVWLLRRLIGLWYRPLEPNGYATTTAIVTPVYNEEPDLFRSALRSWAANGPNEIIAVIDHTDTRCMEQFREFEAECAGTSLILKMLITHTPGKRPALADGILAATSEIVFLVDSDTIWDLDLMPKALAPFIDPEVGGVTMRQRVWHPHSTAQRIFDVYLDIRYIDEIRFLTAFGDAVTCLSGRTAVYRRFVVLTALEDLMEETFWGRPVISGDDKALTLAVQSRGWKVRYQENACVYTPGATVMKVFLKQRLRWARNSWRADLKAVGSRWTWGKPFLFFHLLDRLLQPLTTLMAPLFLGFALFQGNWGAALFLILWWFVSRSIKIMPHIQRHWLNIRILPWYVFFNYWSAVMKIYAFFTMNQQGWITRWSRTGKGGAWAQSLQSMPSYAATTVTIGVMALLVHSLHETPARAANLQEQKAAPVTRTDKEGFSLVALAWPTLNFTGASTIGQCKAPWIVSLPDVLSPKVLAAEALPPQVVAAPSSLEASTEDAAVNSPAHSTLLPASNELCVMDGKASGTCRSYTLSHSDVEVDVQPPTILPSSVGEQSSPLQAIWGWLPVDHRLVAITHTSASSQLCLWQENGQNRCTGYALDIPPAWRAWWQESGLETTLNEAKSTTTPLPTQPEALPLLATEDPAQSLCILQGDSQGTCSVYGIR